MPLKLRQCTLSKLKSYSFVILSVSEDELLRTCPKNLGIIHFVLPRFFASLNNTSSSLRFALNDIEKGLSLNSDSYCT